MFPNCLRRPLPNTLEEAEDKRLPSVSLKQRYPSYRDLKNGKIYSVPVSGNGLNGNVYTIGPNVYNKTDVKQSQLLDMNQSHNLYEQKFVNGLERHESTTSLTHIRPTALYNEDTDSRLSDLEEDLNESNNWRLFSNDLTSRAKIPTNQLDSYDINRLQRDMTQSNLLSRPSIIANKYPHGLPTNDRRLQNEPKESVAETNL